MVFPTGAALRQGQIEVAVCHGQSPQELERAINEALRTLAMKSSDPQLLDIKYPSPSPTGESEWAREYTALLIWQR
jgi:hypothetical protein